MSTSKLICNADDLGLTRRVTDAIIYCHQHGIITSATLMANMPATEYACQAVKNAPSLGVGIHLTLTDGGPVLPPDKVRCLVDPNGTFYDNFQQPRRLWWGRDTLDQATQEFAAQVGRVVDLGVKPTHLDSHHHIQRMPIARLAMAAAAKRFGINRVRTQRACYWVGPNAPVAVRIRCFLKNLRAGHRWMAHQVNHWLLRYRHGLRTPDHRLFRAFLLPKREGALRTLLDAISDLPPGVSEMSFHPGYPDDPALKDSPSFAQVRVTDFELVTNSEVIECVRNNCIGLISFANI